jgi:hypothetical protein
MAGLRTIDRLSSTSRTAPSEVGSLNERGGRDSGEREPVPMRLPALSVGIAKIA